MHYRARVYDPDTGRFLQEDPVWFAAGDMNIYRYVGNNPVNFVDPSGEAKVGYAVAVAGVAGAAIARPLVVKGGRALTAHMVRQIVRARDVNVFQGLAATIGCRFLIASEAFALVGHTNVTVDNSNCSVEGDKPDKPVPQVLPDETPLPTRPEQPNPDDDDDPDDPKGPKDRPNDRQDRDIGGGLPEPDNPKKVNDKWLKRQGVDPHDVKGGVNANSKQDTYVDRNRNVYVGNKDGSGEFEFLGNLEWFL